MTAAPDLIELAEQYGVQFYYVASPSFDLNTAAGRRVARILAANDAGEAEDIAERVTRAKLANAVQGQYMGGARPYGFEGSVKDEHGNITNKGCINVAVVEDEKAVWCDCVARIIGGEREMELIRALNQRGILSPLGAKWRIGNLKKLLIRKRYVAFDAEGHPADCLCLKNPEGSGTLVHRGIEHRAIWPAFISAETHEQLLAAFPYAALSGMTQMILRCSARPRRAIPARALSAICLDRLSPGLPMKSLDSRVRILAVAVFDPS